MQVSTDNLQRIRPHAFERVAVGAWRSPWRDDYDASRILLTDLIESHPVAGDPVVLVPDRETLLLTGSDDAEGLLVVAGIASRHEGRPISGIPLRLSEGSWSPWLPPQDHPVHHHLKALCCDSIESDYLQQSRLLVEQHRAMQTELHVVPYIVMSHEVLGPVGICSWVLGARQLLPRTDLVSLVRMGEVVEIITGDWATVFRVAGHLMAPVGGYPERFLVEGVPSEADLLEIRKSPSSRLLFRSPG